MHSAATTAADRVASYAAAASTAGPAKEEEPAETQEQQQQQTIFNNDFMRSAFNNLHSPIFAADYLKNLGHMVATALDPLGVDVTIDVETPYGERINISGAGKNEAAKNEEVATAEEVKEASNSNNVDEAVKEEVIQKVVADASARDVKADDEEEEEAFKDAAKSSHGILTNP